MTVFQSKFDIEKFELRGETGNFFSSEQKSKLNQVSQRIPAQLNWLAQLLGWNGDDYWFSLASSIDEKRQLLGGTFGVYNCYTYPEVVEVRNWENSVLIKNTPGLKDNQEFVLGDSTYISDSITKEGDFLVIKFPSLSPQFLSDLSSGQQLKYTNQTSLPAPFYRPHSGVSGDRSFHCKESSGNLTLFPDFDVNENFPYVFNTLYSGSRYFFDKPVSLFVTEEESVKPKYDFTKEVWYIDVPCQGSNLGPSARLEYGDSSVVVGVKTWLNPSDWTEKINSFKGVWSNKGGYLPFHFVFDSLSLHGYDQEKSLYLDPVNTEIKFDELLEKLYMQRAEVSETPPPFIEEKQVWWDSLNHKFYIYQGDPLNCGPWVDYNFFGEEGSDIIPDYIISDVSSFEDSEEEFFDGCVVSILDCAGLSETNKVLGVISPLLSSGEVFLERKDSIDGWVPLFFSFQSESEFAATAHTLPAETRVIIRNAEGVSPEELYYKINNLSIEIEEPYSISLMKSVGDEDLWFLPPPQGMKFIGNTRLFSSSIDYDHPTNGEIGWEFSEEQPNQRSISVFYYNGWEFNLSSSQWEMTGEWKNVETFEDELEPPQVLNYGAVLVYCNGNLLEENVRYMEDNFSFLYNVNPLTGSFVFTYSPQDYEGRVSFPTVTISDSLTSAFREDISRIIFSGLKYHITPNVEDSETLLRVWKTQPLFCVNDLKQSTTLSYPNFLVADENLGPSDPHWERYFIKLPPSYERNGREWQKIALICQNFGYWGSSLQLEDTGCPEKKYEIVAYESLKSGAIYSGTKVLYSEPYWYSSSEPEVSGEGEYNNSCISPSFDDPVDGFEEGDIVRYDPFHERRANTNAVIGDGYGDWLGSYFKSDPCEVILGHLKSDTESGVLYEILPPTWDMSIYKAPPTCAFDRESGYVDTNHYKIGYALFAADLSAADEPFFPVG